MSPNNRSVHVPLDLIGAVCIVLYCIVLYQQFVVPIHKKQTRQFVWHVNFMQLRICTFAKKCESGALRHLRGTLHYKYIYRL